MASLQEKAAMEIRSWKAGHEERYADFKRSMESINKGDFSAIEGILNLVESCMPEETDNVVPDVRLDYGTPDEIWRQLPQYVKAYVADNCNKSGNATKDDCLSAVTDMTKVLNQCMSFVPSFLSNLYRKTMKEDNDLIRCMYYYMLFDGGFTKMASTFSDIMEDEIVNQSDMAMMHGCISSLVSSSLDLGTETKGSWERATENVNPEIWKDVCFELRKSKGNRGRTKTVCCIDDMITGNKAEVKRQILRFIHDYPDNICLAYLLQSLVKAGAVKQGTSYIAFHRAIERLTGKHYGIDTPQRRYGELQTFTLNGPQKGSWKRAKEITMLWTAIFRDAV
ncbi:MAG: DUF6043 family protein [Prevotella sp.]|nr:DUF6043 family protein [Prevotella sp.]